MCYQPTHRAGGMSRTLDNLKAMPVQIEIGDYFRVEQRDGVAGDGIAETGMEFFGDRCAADRVAVEAPVCDMVINRIIDNAAVAIAADKIIDKGKRIAAHLLETSEGDIEFADGSTSRNFDVDLDRHQVMAGVGMRF